MHVDLSERVWDYHTGLGGIKTQLAIELANSCGRCGC